MGEAVNSGCSQSGGSEENRKLGGVQHKRGRGGERVNGLQGARVMGGYGIYMGEEGTEDMRRMSGSDGGYIVSPPRVGGVFSGCCPSWSGAPQSSGHPPSTSSVPQISVGEQQGLLSPRIPAPEPPSHCGQQREGRGRPACRTHMHSLCFQSRLVQL